MNITLRPRTAESVKIYFERANAPEIKRVLPQKAQTVEEALEDYEKTLLPGSTSFGLTVWADEIYVGDVWCYCIDPEDVPNCMISYCIFETSLWSRGIATEAVRMFLRVIRENFPITTVGAFTFSHNEASVRVLDKNRFVLVEEFEEDGVMSKYYQLDLKEANYVEKAL